MNLADHRLKDSRFIQYIRRMGRSSSSVLIASTAAAAPDTSPRRTRGPRRARLGPSSSGQRTGAPSSHDEEPSHRRRARAPHRLQVDALTQGRAARLDHQPLGIQAAALVAASGRVPRGPTDGRPGGALPLRVTTCPRTRTWRPSKRSGSSSARSMSTARPAAHSARPGSLTSKREDETRGARASEPARWLVSQAPSPHASPTRPTTRSARAKLAARAAREEWAAQRG